MNDKFENIVENLKELGFKLTPMIHEKNQKVAIVIEGPHTEESTDLFNRFIEIIWVE